MEDFARRVVGPPRLSPPGLAIKIFPSGSLCQEKRPILREDFVGTVGSAGSPSRSDLDRVGTLPVARLPGAC